MKLGNATLKREILAGISTFLAAFYIVIVNPAILSDAGMPFSAVVTATVLVSCFGSLMMGLYAKNPIVVAPGMGINAFFAYSAVVMYGLSYQEALGTVFWSGVIFLLLSVIPPLASSIALVIVGAFMVKPLTKIDWHKPGEAIPCFLTLVLIPFTYSLSTGIAFGFISWTVLRVFGGEAKSLNPVLIVIFIFSLFFLWI